MAALDKVKKHPGETLLITIRFRGLDNREVSGGGVWTVTGLGDLTIGTPDYTLITAFALISGGTAGETYQVEAAIPLNNGEIRVKEFEIVVEDN